MSVDRLTILVAPELLPVSLKEAKNYVRQDDSYDDGLIGTLIQAATEYVETYTQRLITQKKYRYFLDTFPNQLSSRSSNDNQDTVFSTPSEKRGIDIPLFPFISLDLFTYFNEEDLIQTFDQTTISVDKQNNVKSRIILNDGASWPNTSKKSNSVVIEFTSGADKTCAIPATMRIAILQIVAHWYDNRESVTVCGNPKEVPMSTEAILWSERSPTV